MANNKNIFESLGITPVQAVGVAGGLFLFYGIGKKFGFIKGDADNKSDALTTDKMYEPFYTSNLIAQGKKVYVLNSATLQRVAKNIFDAKGFFKDDNDKLWSAIKTIHYKTQVSQVNKYLSDNYNKELFTYLKTYLNADEMAQVFDYFKTLPSGLV